MVSINTALEDRCHAWLRQLAHHLAGGRLRSSKLLLDHRCLLAHFRYFASRQFIRILQLALKSLQPGLQLRHQSWVIASAQREGNALELNAARHLWICALGLFLRVVEVGEQAVVVALRERIILVIVALRTLQRGPKPDCTRGVHAVDDLVDAALLRLGAGFHIRRCAAMKAGCDDLLRSRVGQQIACDLLNGKLVEGQVRIQRIHHPIAIAPDAAQIVALKPVGVRVTRQVQPRARPAHTKLLRPEQAIHH